MRGIMVQALVSRGVPFEAALETASRVRDRVRSLGEVDVQQLSKLIEELLGDHPDLEPIGTELTPSVVNARGAPVPFSKGILAVSLQGAGLDTADAYDVSRELEARLLREGRLEIGRSELRYLVADTIERTHGGNAAERYRIWRQAHKDPRPVFILIGGSTGVGKTSLAVEVARRLEISHVIGTDSIRQIMRLMFSADLMPEIHCSTYDALALALEPQDAGDAVIAGFREQAQKIAVGVHALLDRAVEENTSLLIEGVNLLPSVIDLDRYREHAHVISLVLATLDSGAYRDRFESRESEASRRGASRYLDHFDAIKLVQEHILAEADHLGLPMIDNIRFDDAVRSAIRSVIATLKKSISLPVEEAK